MNINRFIRFAVHQCQLEEYLSRCHDARVKPQIPARQVAWMGILGAVKNSGGFLPIEMLGRQQPVLNFFHLTDRLMVASDSTLARILQGFAPDELEAYLDHLFRKGKEDGTVGIVLDGKRYLAVGADGSDLGGHPAVALLHMGEVPLFAGVWMMDKRGKELPTDKRALAELVERVPELQMVFTDGLGLNQPLIDYVVETLQKAIIVKYRPHPGKRLPLVLQDAIYVVNSSWAYPDSHEYVTFSGWQDRTKHLHYHVWVVRQMETMGTTHTVDVAIVVVMDEEESAVQDRFFVVSAGVHLSPEAMAKAGRMRWQIENEGFKLLNAVTHSKHRYSQDPVVTRSVLLLLMIGLNLVRLFYRWVEQEIEQRYRGSKHTLKFVLVCLQETFSMLIPLLEEADSS